MEDIIQPITVFHVQTNIPTSKWPQTELAFSPQAVWFLSATPHVRGWHHSLFHCPCQKLKFRSFIPDSFAPPYSYLSSYPTEDTPLYFSISSHFCLSAETTFLLNYSGFLSDGLAVPFSNSLQDAVDDHAKDQVRLCQDPAYNMYWLLTVLKIKFPMHIHFITWICSSFQIPLPYPNPRHSLLLRVPLLYIAFSFFLAFAPHNFCSSLFL